MLTIFLVLLRDGLTAILYVNTVLTYSSLWYTLCTSVYMTDNISISTLFAGILKIKMQRPNT